MSGWICISESHTRLIAEPFELPNIVRYGLCNCRSCDCEAVGRDPETLRRSYLMFDANARPSGGHIAYYDSPQSVRRHGGPVARSWLHRARPLLPGAPVAAFPDRHFDAIVATFLFCVLDDELQLPALRELKRICKPDGVIEKIVKSRNR